MKAGLTVVASALRIGASSERRKIAFGPLVIAAFFGTGVQEWRDVVLGRDEDDAGGTVAGGPAAVDAQICGCFAVGI